MKDNGLKLPKHYIERYLTPKVNLLTHNILQYSPRGYRIQVVERFQQKRRSTIAEIEMFTLGRFIRSLDTGIFSVYFAVYTKR